MDAMNGFCRIAVVVFFLVVGVAVPGSAEDDMSLPKPRLGGGKDLRVVGAPSQTPPLVNVFAAPDGAMRGLAYDGQYLWAANSGDGNSMYGSKIYKLDPDSGTVVRVFNGPSSFSCGLAWDGEYLWYSAYITGQIFQLDTATMNVEKAFAAPTTHPFDLAWDGAYLYAVRGNQAYISVIDTSTGQEVDSIAATYSSPNVRPFGLTFLPRNAPQLLVSDGNYGSNFVSTWNFPLGAWVDQWASEPTSYPSGLAYDSVTERLWVSCYVRDSIYVYDVSQVGMVSDAPQTVSSCGIHAYPNPFSRKIKIRYAIRDSGYTLEAANQNIRESAGGVLGYQKPELKIYDAAGRFVKSFCLESSIVSHESVVWWDGTDDSGNNLPAGVYFLATPLTNGRVKLVKSHK